MRRLCLGTATELHVPNKGSMHSSYHFFPLHFTAKSY